MASHVGDEREHGNGVCDDHVLIMIIFAGKEAEAEVVYAASFFEYFSGEAERATGLTIPAANPACRILTVKQPIGVVACLCPWNVSAPS